MNNESKLKTLRTVLQVDNEIIDNIVNLIEDGAERSLLNIFADLHPADIAEIINHIDLHKAKYIFSLLDTETASDVITEIDENLREKILKDIDIKKITDIIDELYTDDATDIVSDLPEQVAKQVLKNIDKEDSEDVKELLKYPEDSAGGIMTSNFVSVDSKATIKDAIEEVRKNADEFDNIYHIYVLKEEGILLGIVTLKSLLTNPLHQNISKVIEDDLMFVTPEVDQEEVAAIMNKYDLVAIPVVDEHRRMLGRITFDDIQDVIHEEATEDMQRIAGLTDEEETGDSIFTISKNRLPWLVFALFMELFNSLIFSSYEEYIQQFFIAAFFVPIVMAMGGSTGTQTAIVTVRGLNIGGIWLKDSLKNILKEFSVALLNGIMLATILCGAVLLMFPRSQLSYDFAFVLAFSLVVVIINAAIVGAAIPLLLKKMKADPAIATGPFVTASNDILGLSIYLTIITLYFF